MSPNKMNEPKTTQRKKTGPRDGHHSEDARRKMREQWDRRKKLIEMGRKLEEVIVELEG